MSNTRIWPLALIVVVQAVAALYFLIDGVDDALEQAKGGIAFEIIMDGVVAFALIAGIVIGVRYYRAMVGAMAAKDRALDVARGALAEQIARRFAEWGLTSGEADVALFAMKGCSVAEIAELRGAAAGTVRSQLSQVYAKAGVNSQSMLVALFMEDLIDLPQA